VPELMLVAEGRGSVVRGAWMLMVWMEAEASRRSEEPSFFGVVVRRLGTLRFLLVGWCK